MTFNVNISIDSQSPEGSLLESIMTRDHVSPEEAVRSALQTLATPTSGRKATKAPPLSQEEIAHFDQICPIFKALEDVPDETWQRIATGRLRTEGLPTRG